MAIMYEWKFGPLKVETVNNVQNVVTGINYMCTAQDLERSSSYRGVKTGFAPVPEVDPTLFVSIDDLTASIVEEWVNLKIPKSEIEELCAMFLEQQLSPPVRIVELHEDIANTISNNMSSPGFVSFENSNPPNVSLIDPKIDSFILNLSAQQEPQPIGPMIVNNSPIK